MFALVVDPSPQEDALQRGVMPRTTDYDGNTLLHAACSRGALRAAKLVVRWAVYSTHPPDRNFLNLQSASGYTALDLAREGGHHKMEEWLIALGALGRGGTGAGTLTGANVGGGGGMHHHQQYHHGHAAAAAHYHHHQQQQPYGLHGGGGGGGQLPPPPYGAANSGPVGYGHGPGGVGMLGQPPGTWGVPPPPPHHHPSGWGAGPPRPPAVPDTSYGGYGSGGGGGGGGGGYGSGGDSSFAGGISAASLAGLVGGGVGGGGGTGDYLMGALEAALGGGTADRGLQSEDRRRAQAVVKQVAEVRDPEGVRGRERGRFPKKNKKTTVYFFRLFFFSFFVHIYYRE